MTRRITINNQETYILPRPTGAVVWYGNHRIELDRFELNELASAFAEAAAPRMEAVA